MKEKGNVVNVSLRVSFCERSFLVFFKILQAATCCIPKKSVRHFVMGEFLLFFAAMAQW